MSEQVIATFNNLVETMDDYDEVTLSELCFFQEGYVNPAQTHPEYFDGDVKWLRAVDINESFIVNTSRTLTRINISPKKDQMLPYIYAYLKSRQLEFPDLAVGSVQKNLYVSVLEPLKIKMPKNKRIIEEYCELARIQLDQILKHCLENDSLISLRDTLLPKLMSGELDVSDLEI